MSEKQSPSTGRGRCAAGPAPRALSPPLREQKGLRQRTRELCYGLVGLPMRGRVESLSVGTAAAALLNEAGRRTMS